MTNGQLLDVPPNYYLKDNSNTVMKVGILGVDILRNSHFGSRHGSNCAKQSSINYRSLLTYYPLKPSKSSRK